MIIEWVLEAFDGINQESIMNSFKHCAINLSLDGKEDHLLNKKIDSSEEFMATVSETLLSQAEYPEIDEITELREEFIAAASENTFEPTMDNFEHVENSSDEDEDNAEVNQFKDTQRIDHELAMIIEVSKMRATLNNSNLTLEFK